MFDKRVSSKFYALLLTVVVVGVYLNVVSSGATRIYFDSTSYGTYKDVVFTVTVLVSGSEERLAGFDIYINFDLLKAYPTNELAPVVLDSGLPNGLTVFNRVTFEGIHVAWATFSPDFPVSDGPLFSFELRGLSVGFTSLTMTGDIADVDAEPMSVSFSNSIIHVD